MPDDIKSLHGIEAQDAERLYDAVLKLEDYTREHDFRSTSDMRDWILLCLRQLSEYIYKRSHA